MNIITDTLDEIKKMRFRKVTIPFLTISLVTFARPKFRYDRLLGTHDLENTHGLH